MTVALLYLAFTTPVGRISRSLEVDPSPGPKSPVHTPSFAGLMAIPTGPLIGRPEANTEEAPVLGSTCRMLVPVPAVDPWLKSATSTSPALSFPAVSGTTATL